MNPISNLGIDLQIFNSRRESRSDSDSVCLHSKFCCNELDYRLVCGAIDRLGLDPHHIDSVFSKLEAFWASGTWLDVNLYLHFPESRDY